MFVKIYSSNNQTLKLVDSDFTEFITIEGDNWLSSVKEEVSIIKIYQNRNLNVVPPLLTYNVNQVFGLTATLFNDIKRWKGVIDRDFPELEYGKKIFPCVAYRLKSKRK